MISPSSMERALACPASVRASDGIESKTSPAAERGTFLHSLLLPHLESRAQKLVLKKTDRKNLTDDEFDVLTKAADSIRELISETSTSKGFIKAEHQVDLKPFGIQKTGREGEHSVDLIWVGKNDCVHILDFKSGKEPVTEPEKNAQLLTYAVACRKAFKEAHKIKVWICQPRVKGSELVGADISESYLNIFDNALTEFMRDVNDETLTLPFLPSEKACRWCPARSTCYARKAESEGKAQKKAEFNLKINETLSILSKPIMVEANIHGPIVIFDEAVIVKAKELSEKADSIAMIESKDSAELAAALLKEITTFEKAIDKNRLNVKRPVTDLGKAIDKAAEQALGPLGESKQKVKDSLEDYVTRTAEKVSGAVATPITKWALVENQIIPKEFFRVDLEKIDDYVKDGKLKGEPWLKVWTETQVKAR